MNSTTTLPLSPSVSTSIYGYDKDKNSPTIKTGLSSSSPRISSSSSSDSNNSHSSTSVSYTSSFSPSTLPLPLRVNENITILQQRVQELEGLLYSTVSRMEDTERSNVSLLNVKKSEDDDHHRRDNDEPKVIHPLVISSSSPSSSSSSFLPGGPDEYLHQIKQYYESRYNELEERYRAITDENERNLSRLLNVTKQLDSLHHLHGTEIHYLYEQWDQSTKTIKELTEQLDQYQATYGILNLHNNHDNNNDNDTTTNSSSLSPSPPVIIDELRSQLLVTETDNIRLQKDLKDIHYTVQSMVQKLTGSNNTVASEKRVPSNIPTTTNHNVPPSPTIIASSSAASSNPISLPILPLLHQLSLILDQYPDIQQKLTTYDDLTSIIDKLSNDLIEHQQKTNEMTIKHQYTINTQREEYLSQIRILQEQNNQLTRELRDTRPDDAKLYQEQIIIKQDHDIRQLNDKLRNQINECSVYQTMLNAQETYYHQLLKDHHTQNQQIQSTSIEEMRELKNSLQRLEEENNQYKQRYIPVEREFESYRNESTTLIFQQNEDMKQMRINIEKLQDEITKRDTQLERMYTNLSSYSNNDDNSLPGKERIIISPLTMGNLRNVGINGDNNVENSRSINIVSPQLQQRLLYHLVSKPNNYGDPLLGNNQSPRYST